jgi:hypothetical protein
MGVTIDGFCIRNSTPGPRDDEAVDQFIPGSGTWGEATAGARAAHRAEMAAKAEAAAAAAPAIQVPQDRMATALAETTAELAQTLGPEAAARLADVAAAVQAQAAG